VGYHRPDASEQVTQRAVVQLIAQRDSILVHHPLGLVAGCGQIRAFREKRWVAIFSHSLRHLGTKLGTPTVTHTQISPETRH